MRLIVIGTYHYFLGCMVLKLGSFNYNQKLIRYI